MSDLWAQLPAYAAAHLELSLLALAAACAVAIPLGVAIAGRSRLAGVVLGVAGVIQTIPSLALLALMVPLFAALGAITAARFGVELRAIGTGPALVALVLYGTLPILQNTVAGLASVDPAARAAARAVGMTPLQSLLRVELPLALPVLVAGVRTAAVWIVGTATLSTPVGAPSLGNFIFSGLQTRRFASVWLGCLAAAALALAIDGAIRLLESGVRRRRTGLRVAGLMVLLLLAAATLVVRCTEGRAATARPVRIGAKSFTEQYVLAALLEGWIAREGAAAETLPSLGSTVLFDALRTGEIDVYVDYSGTLWTSILGGGATADEPRFPRSEPKASGAGGAEGALQPGRDAVLDQVRRGLAERYGIRVAAALGFENTYALAMAAARARALGVATFGDLARVAPQLELGADYEFLARPEWRALVAAYGFAFRATRSMDPSLMYEAAAAGEVDVISAFSTDGRIAAFGLTVLRDERGIVPPYDAVVLVGRRLARERPDVADALARLEGAIDAGAMRRMNAAVDHDGRAPVDVAREWLAAHPR
jgi:osmoprotectant transport system permease protein